MAPSEAPLGTTDAVPVRQPTILLVEDEILIRMDIGDELRNAGWTVYEAGSADAAIELLRSPILIDLVLTDVQMPGSCDGIGLVEFVRKERPTVRVAVMSGHYVPNWQKPHLFDGFFPKPLHTELVVKQLRDLIAGTQPQ